MINKEHLNVAFLTDFVAGTRDMCLQEPNLSHAACVRTMIKHDTATIKGEY